MTERNLHERLALSGPGDEIKHLADTIDGLLARLEAAFEAQRHFVASASHELRTPRTLDRALLEIALADPARPPRSCGPRARTCWRPGNSKNGSWKPSSPWPAASGASTGTAGSTWLRSPGEPSRCFAPRPTARDCRRVSRSAMPTWSATQTSSSAWPPTWWTMRSATTCQEAAWTCSRKPGTSTPS
ncbi:MAG: hypothetical protein ACLQDY_22180 [Streptosporangiaceae bacterium]